MDRVEQWRQGFFAQTRWEDLAIDDMDVRLKWAGLFHRKRRTPGRFMLRLKVRDSAVPCLLRLCASPGIAASCTCSESGSQCSCLCRDEKNRFGMDKARFVACWLIWRY